MAVSLETINIGTIANDGTGDDLRQAMVKINNNFTALNDGIETSLSATNIGTAGQGVFAQRSDNELQFKKLVAGSRITLSSDNESITITADNAISQLISTTDSGSLVVSGSSGVLPIYGGEGINTRVESDSIYVDLDVTEIVSRDASPALSADLNAQENDIDNAGTITADSFVGPLTGLVYDFDVRTLQPYVEGFDFGEFRPVYTNSLDFILAQSDVDFGSIVGAGVSQVIVDLGSIA